MPDDLVERLRSWHTSGETITGDVQLYLDAADEIERLRAQRAAAEAAISSVVHTVGGTVEGHPTSEINYLQRLRELIRAEDASSSLHRHRFTND